MITQTSANSAGNTTHTAEKLRRAAVITLRERREAMLEARYWILDEFRRGGVDYACTFACVADLLHFLPNIDVEAFGDPDDLTSAARVSLATRDVTRYIGRVSDGTKVYPAFRELEERWRDCDPFVAQDVFRAPKRALPKWRGLA